MMKKYFFDNKFVKIGFLIFSFIISFGLIFLIYRSLAVAPLVENEVQIPKTWQKVTTPSNTSIIEVTIQGKNLNENQAELKINETRVLESGYSSRPRIDKPELFYTLEVLDSSQKVIDKMVFQPRRTLDAPPPEPGKPDLAKPVTRETFTEVLNLNWNERAATVNLKQGTRVIDTKSVSQLKKIKNKNQVEYEVLDGEKLERKSSRGEPSKAYAHNGKVHVAIIGDNYSSTSLDKFDGDAGKILGGFKSVHPYQGRISQFSFSKIRNTIDLGCHYDGRLIVCNEGTVNQVLNNKGVSRDQVIVLMNNSTYGGSGGSISVAYAGAYTGGVSVHEFTHTFASISDEYNYYASNGSLTNSIYSWGGYYTYACYAGTPPYSGWSGQVARLDYNKGCLYPNYYRASSSSLMFEVTSKYFNTPSLKRINQVINQVAGLTTDTTAPYITFGAPANGSTVSGTTTITAKAYDIKGTTSTGAQITEKVARIEITIDGSLYKTLYQSASGYDFKYSIDTTRFSNGAHVINVRAFDGSEKNASRTKTVYFRN